MPLSFSSIPTPCSSKPTGVGTALDGKPYAAQTQPDGTIAVEIRIPFASGSSGGSGFDLGLFFGLQ